MDLQTAQTLAPAATISCVGAALDRLQLSTALSILARRLPDLTRADGFAHRYRPSATMRQHTALPATLGPARCPVAHGQPPPVGQP